MALIFIESNGSAIRVKRLPSLPGKECLAETPSSYSSTNRSLMPFTREGRGKRGRRIVEHLKDSQRLLAKVGAPWAAKEFKQEQFHIYRKGVG